MSETSPDQWREWLADFRQRLIKAEDWSEKEAKLRLRDRWAVVRDGRVHVLTKDAQRPADAVPVFQLLTPGGWMTPLEIIDHLTGLVGKAMTSQRSPRDIVLGLLDLAEHAEGPDESYETKQKRHSAAFWGHQLLDACEDKALAGVTESDAFWQAVLSAFQAGRRHTILELYRNPQLLADLIKAQAFQSGRGPDELSRRLEASYREQSAKRGRPPKLQEVAKAAGGKWSDTEACWQFDGVPGSPSVTPRGLRERLKVISRSHRT